MIRDYLGPWGFMIVLAPKPHQETVSTINKCVWRLCASYHALNAVTICFTFTSPRCSESVEDFGDSKGTIFYIKLNNCLGYH